MLPPELIPDYPVDFGDFLEFYEVVDSGTSLCENLVGYPGLGRKHVARELLGQDLETCRSTAGWSWWYRGHSNWAIGPLALSTDCQYRTSADTKPDINLIKTSRNPSILPLTGIKVGIIEKIVPYLYYHHLPTMKISTKLTLRSSTI
jgi:hypothetical protein